MDILEAAFAETVDEKTGRISKAEGTALVSELEKLVVRDRLFGDEVTKIPQHTNGSMEAGLERFCHSAGVGLLDDYYHKLVSTDAKFKEARNTYLESLEVQKDMAYFFDVFCKGDDSLLPLSAAILIANKAYHVFKLRKDFFNLDQEKVVSKEEFERVEN